MTITVRRDQLIAARIKAGFSQRKLASKAGLSSGYMSQLERGYRNPSPKAARKICDTLDVDFDQIFELETPLNQAAATS